MISTAGTPNVVGPVPGDAAGAEVAVCIADIGVRASAAQPDLHLQLASPDDRFATSPSHPDIQFSVAVGDVPSEVPGTVLFGAGSVWRASSDDRDLYLELYRSPRRPAALRLLRLDPETGRGELTIAPQVHEGLLAEDGGFTVQPFVYPLLQLLVYWQLARVGGMAFHAGSVAFGDLGCLFMGVSGAGKSTITRLCLDAGAESLSDDRVAVNLRSGSYHVFGTPWHGTPERSRPACAPLRAVFLIEHGPSNELTPLSERDACSLLLARAFPPYFSHDLLGRSLATCSAIAGAIPCYRLRFVPDASVVSLVLAAAEGR